MASPISTRSSTSKAAAALTRALSTDAPNVNARRMLALASLNVDDFAKAVELLRDDPQRDTDPSMQFAYGVALVRSGHAAEAETTFSRLVAAHADSAELNVVLGQAHAEQGDYDGAIASLQHALELQGDVAEANSTLGIIYFKQGKLAEASKALQAELTSHPENVKARFMLATVLDLDGHSVKPSRNYGRSSRRVPNTPTRGTSSESCCSRAGRRPRGRTARDRARLAPDDANIHFQLAQAYQKTGHGDLAQQQFDLYQKLKDKRRGRTDR